MLYNPNWQQKPDIFSLDSLIAWLGTKDPKEEYSYTSNCNCMLANYLKDHGHTGVFVGAGGTWRAVGASGTAPFEFFMIAKGSGCFVARRWTYSDALDRAKAIQGGCHVGNLTSTTSSASMTPVARTGMPSKPHGEIVLRVGIGWSVILNLLPGLLVCSNNYRRRGKADDRSI